MLGSAGVKGQPAQPWRSVIFELSPLFKSCWASQLKGGVSGKTEGSGAVGEEWKTRREPSASFCSLQTPWNSISTCSPSPAALSSCLQKWPGFLLTSSMLTLPLVSLTLLRGEDRKFDMWLHILLICACLWLLAQFLATITWTKHSLMTVLTNLTLKSLRL